MTAPLRGVHGVLVSSLHLSLDIPRRAPRGWSSAIGEQNAVTGSPPRDIPSVTNTGIQCRGQKPVLGCTPAHSISFRVLVAKY